MMEINTSDCSKRLPGRPKDPALQDRRRSDILDQAALIFARHGFANADVQWIADALSISKGTIYRYFPSKEELFLAAVRRGVERLHVHIEAAKQSAGTPMELISAAVHAYLQFFKTNPQLVELFIQERSNLRGEIGSKDAAPRHDAKPIYFEHRDVRRGPFRELITRLIADGIIRPMPAERVIDVLGDVLYGTMFTNHFAGRDKPFESQAQDILDVVFNGILTDSHRQAQNKLPTHERAQ